MNDKPRERERERGFPKDHGQTKEKKKSQNTKVKEELAS